MAAQHSDDPPQPTSRPQTTTDEDHHSEANQSNNESNSQHGGESDNSEAGSSQHHTCSGKSHAEFRKEREAAQHRINQILHGTRPKNLVQGVKSGVGNVLSGALGAVGVAVLVPTLGAAQGFEKAGVFGGVFGLAGGAVLGALGAAVVVVGGVASGVTQVVRGVAAMPQAFLAPRMGKWWNETEGRWVKTNLVVDAKRELRGVPDDDSDLLGEIQNHMDEKSCRCEEKSEDVADSQYYEDLGVSPTADAGVIKRRYYVLARKYHPDMNPDDTDAIEKFQSISEAYQVLSDEAQRAAYDKLGREGLKSDEHNDESIKIDNSLLFAFLFGSDKFQDITGRLAHATSASVGDSMEVSAATARKIQHRRVLRLAVKLVERITPLVELRKGHGNMRARQDIVRRWKAEARALCKASFGYQMVGTVGKIYNMLATQHLGSLDSGHGLPALADWAAGMLAAIQERHAANVNKMEKLEAGLELLQLQDYYRKQSEEATSEEEKKAVMEKMKREMGEITCRVLWTANVVDITATLHEVCQNVFFDQSVDNETRRIRAQVVNRMGEVWMAVTPPDDMPAAEKDTAQLYEEATFAAMLETAKRKDDAAHHGFGHSFRHSYRQSISTTSYADSHHWPDEDNASQASRNEHRHSWFSGGSKTHAGSGHHMFQRHHHVRHSTGAFNEAKGMETLDHTLLDITEATEVSGT